MHRQNVILCRNSVPDRRMIRCFLMDADVGLSWVIYRCYLAMVKGPLSYVFLRNTSRELPYLGGQYIKKPEHIKILPIPRVYNVVKWQMEI